MHWAALADPTARIFSLDTGRLHEQTYVFAETLRRRFGLAIEWYTPDRSALEALLKDDGLFGFRTGLEARRRCCAVRKVEPLLRILDTANAWVTGQRRHQSVTRSQLQLVESEDGRTKYNPLADWTSADVTAETKRLGLPEHPLYAEGFTSIGCAPCTRATRDGENERAGRWWWEHPEHKECGLHQRREAVGS
nr:adenosine 5'-phosphosulfate reductase-like [Nerophis lumbriciformis]